MCSPEVLNIEGVLSEYSTLFLQMHMDPPATRANLAMDAFWLLTFVNLNPRQFHKRWNSNTSNAADFGAPFLPRPWNYLVAWRLNMLEHAAMTPKVEASAHFETCILEGLTYLCQPSQRPFFLATGSISLRKECWKYSSKHVHVSVVNPSTRGWTVPFPRFRLQLCVGSVAVWPYVGVTQMTQRKLKAWKGMAGVCKNHELRRAFWWFKNLALDSEAHPVRSTGAVATGTRGSLGRNGEGDKEATWMEKNSKAAMVECTYTWFCICIAWFYRNIQYELCVIMIISFIYIYIYILYHITW